MRFGLDAFSDINVSGLIDRVNLKTLSSKAILPDSASIDNALFNGLVRVRGNLVTTGLVDRIKVAEVAQDVVYGRKSESQRITSRKLVQQAMSLPIFRFEKLNSISKDSLIRTSSSELITSKIMLLNTTAMHRVMTKDSLIGGLDFVHLNESRISLSLPSIVRGVVRMSGLTSSNPVKLVGRINRFHPSDDFVNKHSAQKVSGITKFMSSSLFAGSLWTKDIAAPRIAEIDVRNLYGRRVSLSGDQSIRSRVAIEHSRCSKLSTFRLDNEEFRSFLTRLVLKDSRKVLTGPFTFTQAQFTNQLTSRNGMNRGINLARLHQSAIKSKSTLNSVSGSLVFASGFMSRTAAAKGLINDVSVNRLASESLSSRDVTGIRLKKVKFGKGFRVSGDIISQAVNHKNLRTSVLSRKHNQTIRANLIVNRLLQSKNIISRGTICGLRLRNFAASVMRTNALNHVEGNLVFREAVHVLKNVRTRTGKIKGVALRQLAQSCLPKHLDSRVLAPFRFTNRVVMNGLKTHRVNLMSLPRLLKDYALRKTNIGYSIKRPKFVNLQKAVSGFRTTGQGNVLISRNVVNGQRLNDFQNLGLPIFGSMVAVAGSKRFQNVVHSSLGIKVQGPVNRVRIPQDVLLLRSPSVQVLQGRKVFNNGVFNSLATVKGTTNGFRLPALAQDTLFKHSEQRISGRKYFKGTIQLAKMSHVKVFNGHRNISEYVTQCKTSTVQILEGRPLIRRPLLVKGKTSVSGMIGHLNLSQFLETAVFRKGKSFSRFRHPVKFGRLVLQGPVRVSGPLNGLNVEHFARDVYGHTGAVLRKSEISARMTKDHTQEANQLFKTIDSPSFGIESFKHHQNLDGVYGSLFEQQAPKLLALADIRKTGVNATVYHLRLSDTDQFMVRRVDQNVAYVQRIYFTLQDNEFALHRPSFNSMDREAYVFQGHKKLGSLGTFVDDVHVFKYSPKMVLVASLSAVQGKLRMFLVKHSKPTSPAALIQIASINVGPSATKVVSFSISGVVHIAVARSFRDLCSVADSGSLIFRFDGFSKFELIQRLSVVDSSVLAHYHNNEQHYLVFSNRDDSGYSDEPQSIHIYRAQTSSTTSCQFTLFQKVKFDNINDVAVFAFGPSRSIGLYMAAVNRTTLQVWKQDGAAGFDKSWAMAATGGRALLPMLHRDNLYMLVATDSKRNCMGSLVFKAKSSGTSLSPLLLEDGTRESS
ncbi:hypothetical protein HDE_00364 [Halotydeus destructor]|nr:hypothetical protein HDE_00364 [Halotydeus destructor]